MFRVDFTNSNCIDTNGSFSRNETSLCSPDDSTASEILGTFCYIVTPPVAGGYVLREIFGNAVCSGEALFAEAYKVETCVLISDNYQMIKSVSGSTF